MTADDCRLDTFRAGGKGGQNQNVRDTGVRFTHNDSGAVGEARDGRKQGENKRKAWTRMAKSDKFQSWARLTVATDAPRQLIYVNVKDWEQKMSQIDKLSDEDTL